ncbi:head-tail connector protein [Methylobacterium durans]|uniref:head-tail connector protein n=1 Tax=Methylobacterium durans TaxID=2202825 RepID=UPI002AFE59CE|nr:head-tail connector protein [Methylobacterium durans]MEA1831731.1 head-tail connector protein [Methylobacterium durans]
MRLRLRPARDRRRPQEGAQGRPVAVLVPLKLAANGEGLQLAEGGARGRRLRQRYGSSGMRLTLIEASSADLVTLEEAKRHMRVETDDDDALIDSLIKTAVAKLDGRNGRLGRSLIEAKYRLSLSTFTDEIALPLPPTRSIDHVEYVDAAGVPCTLDADECRVIGLDDEAGAILARAPRHPWPWTAGGPESVQISFTAGYRQLPNPLRTAILIHVGHLYDHREVLLGGSSEVTTPMGYEDLIGPFAEWAC